VQSVGQIECKSSRKGAAQYGLFVLIPDFSPDCVGDAPDDCPREVYEKGRIRCSCCPNRRPKGTRL
jgi:hypothetical protein